jgi:hypothetical protein
MLTLTCVLRFLMEKEPIPFPVRMVLVSTIKDQPVVDEVYEDRDSLLEDLAAMVSAGDAPTQDTQVLADKLLRRERVRIDQTILAVFPCEG